ncbi:MAG: hypothetical protein WBD48_14255, partial [Pseudolabrys sp.]
RGRRGGRRNRHGRNGDAPFPSNTMSGGEQGPQDYQDDFDRPSPPPRDEAPTQESAPAYSPPPPRPETPAPAPTPAAASEPPRRRSTIREPAPFSSGESSAPMPSPTLPPPPTPVISSTGEGETAQPKRGWWGKRLLGDKG